MNLKEAFRFQNKLTALMEETQDILGRPSNITTVTKTTLLHKVMPEAADETVTEVSDTEYSGYITELAGFLLYLLGERETLSAAIRRAKDTLDIDMDGEVSLNAVRQKAAHTLRQMNDLRSSEQVISNGGTGYRFNADGNQISYRCDLKRVMTINYDRKVIRTALEKLNRRADEVSAKLDLCLVSSKVDYQAPFDVNASFSQIFEAFAGISQV